LGRFWAPRQLLNSRTFAKKELVYTAPGKELKWWRPTPEALLALGLLPTPIFRRSRRWNTTLTPRRHFRTILKRKLKPGAHL
jgi:hypothetical protein